MTAPRLNTNEGWLRPASKLATFMSDVRPEVTSSGPAVRRKAGLTWEK